MGRRLARIQWLAPAVTTARVTEQLNDVWFKKTEITNIKTKTDWFFALYKKHVFTLALTTLVFSLISRISARSVHIRSWILVSPDVAILR